MRKYIIILLVFTFFSAQSQTLKYGNDGTIEVIDEDDVILFDSLEKVVTSLSFWEARLAGYATKIDKIEKNIRELRKEGNRLGGYQDRVDKRHNGAISNLSKYQDKDIKIEFNANTNRVRCMEVTDTIVTYVEREQNISPHPDTIELITVIDTVYTPKLKSLGRIKMKSPESFEFDGFDYYRVQKRRQVRWVRKDDKSIYFR